MGGWSEPEDDHPSFRVPESRHGAAPVLLAGVGGLLVAGDLLAPLDKAWAAPARDDLLFELCERVEALFGEVFFVLCWFVQAP